jgi:hypothetical protein
MAGASHSRTLDSPSVHKLHRHTSTADGGGIRRNDPTSYCPPGASESPAHYTSDIDPYYRQNTTMTDAESQYSQETMVASRAVKFSRRVSTALTFWQRLNGKGRQRIGWSASLRAITTFTCKPEFFMSIQLAQCGLSLHRA